MEIIHVVEIVSVNNRDEYTYRGNGEDACILPTPDEARLILSRVWPQCMTEEEYDKMRGVTNGE